MVNNTHNDNSKHQFPNGKMVKPQKKTCVSRILSVFFYTLKWFLKIQEYNCSTPFCCNNEKYWKYKGWKSCKTIFCTIFITPTLDIMPVTYDIRFSGITEIPLKKTKVFSVQRISAKVNRIRNAKQRPTRGRDGKEAGENARIHQSSKWFGAYTLLELALL